MSFNSEVNGEEKIAIKGVLIGSFREPVPQIAVQIAELIARIARYDFIPCSFIFGLKFKKTLFPLRLKSLSDLPSHFRCSMTKVSLR